jgi:hypothetical protein
MRDAKQIDIAAWPTDQLHAHRQTAIVETHGHADRG